MFLSSIPKEKFCFIIIHIDPFKSRGGNIYNQSNYNNNKNKNTEFLIATVEAIKDLNPILIKKDIS